MRAGEWVAWKAESKAERKVLKRAALRAVSIVALLANWKAVDSAARLGRL